MCICKQYNVHACVCQSTGLTRTLKKAGGRKVLFLSKRAEVLFFFFRRVNYNHSFANYDSRSAAPFRSKLSVWRSELIKSHQSITTSAVLTICTPSTLTRWSTQARLMKTRVGAQGKDKTPQMVGIRVSHCSFCFGAPPVVTLELFLNTALVRLVTPSILKPRLVRHG